jgi:hypothetical protein
MMWNEEKQQRLDDFRLREAQGTLTSPEQAEMEALFAELDAEEAEAMRPVLERMEETQAKLQQEIDRRAAEATRLERIVREHKQLVAEARPARSTSPQEVEDRRRRWEIVRARLGWDAQAALTPKQEAEVEALVREEIEAHRQEVRQSRWRGCSSIAEQLS